MAEIRPKSERSSTAAGHATPARPASRDRRSQTSTAVKSRKIDPSSRLRGAEGFSARLQDALVGNKL
ncbi:hypothetical protein N7509_008534 [Penicillium cosmopolitanum]|uniref:Uncharacterized protein n=1 Tax=Penicillium cosmopolitanum TaxID=1131564 RepID=A0A9W9VMR5_9EURO|nr:uncharacterized protein N7509_008534 [Penicillium cosmopolitanum]KAJ5385993.1 hypothetical protein N7509_008534 [Penicillium cosmopolitanum]